MSTPCYDHDNSLRIAILLNSWRSRFLPAIRASYIRTIGAVAPDARLSFFEPANRPGDFPDPARFDLIVFGGANVDPRKSHPWILEIHAFLRHLLLDYPTKKILGICVGCCPLWVESLLVACSRKRRTKAPALPCCRQVPTAVAEAAGHTDVAIIGKVLWICCADVLSCSGAIKPLRGFWEARLWTLLRPR